MTTHPLLDRLDAGLAEIDRQHLRRRHRVVSTPCQPHLSADGRDVLAFASNDYLGLAAHPKVVEALIEGAQRYGAGSGASHLISGHSQAHAELEDVLADFMSPHLVDGRALYFCTGYMANLATISALANKDSEIFSEALNHASLIDGARLSRAKTHVYPHGDVDALAALLDASTAETKLIVTDGVFSMDGDIAPLPQLLALAERHNAWLIVDDAHGFGVVGENGRGVFEHFDMRSPNLVIIGTLGKAAGVGGAFVAAHRSVIEWLINRARPYIFTTAAAPSQAHALLTSLAIIAGDEGRERRATLQARIAQLRDSLTLKHWHHMVSPTGVQPIILGENAAALHAQAGLAEAGLWVPAIRPPTVAPGTSRLRLTLSAAHTAEDVARLTRAINQLDNDWTEHAHG
ncbi:8-amino-7-oxononanoate synthase [Pandoraea sputorum]|uniref:8-amino-7-oxononanoate synthase n=1 Tax=Pandoraea sputorum TaxID=93222 RepID=A0A239S7H2_9BURK|nr:8-amino-7-oxononanoate synthase [Pandoraea sputorum]AJC15768.1 8-amino-7-oxononanoate synthase [Pandoraea sputorum]BET12874.1 8-amino-7-oxononanoate synthase [Pandoraea sputorum]SNU81350.1 8-amino-7-oxononanoate synthase [Pandoraea sputorum]VVD67876.1 8-amino-7-oxononanoate synthase [Pandoraea sputorum]